MAQCPAESLRRPRCETAKSKSSISSRLQTGWSIHDTCWVIASSGRPTATLPGKRDITEVTAAAVRYQRRFRRRSLQRSDGHATRCARHLLRAGRLSPGVRRRQRGMPQNIALLPDGTLLYTLPDRLCGKDLYEPQKGLKFGDSTTMENNPVFAGVSGDDQLVVAEGRVLAVSNNGSVRVLSLDDGHESNNALGTGENNAANVWLRLVGPRLYVISQRSAGCNLISRRRTGSAARTAGCRQTCGMVLPSGNRHVVLLDQPFPLNGQPPDAGRKPLHISGCSRTRATVLARPGR